MSSQTSVLKLLFRASAKIILREEEGNENGSNTTMSNVAKADSNGLGATLLSDFVGVPAIFSNIWHTHLLREYSLSNCSVLNICSLPIDALRLFLLWTRAAEVRVASMSDSEFYDDSTRVLRGLELERAISILSHAAWALISNNKTPDNVNLTSTFLSTLRSQQERQKEYGLVRRSVVRLLRTLYNKNCRRRYCDDKAWEVPAVCSAIGASIASSSLIQEVPFMIPFSTRSGLLQSAIISRQYGMEEVFNLYVVRSSIVEDTRAAFLGGGPRGELRKRLVVEFAGEEGVDGGGLCKELLSIVTQDIFGQDRGLFVTTTADGALYPSPDLGAINSRRLDDYRFAGMLVGSCIRHGVLLDLPFAQFFLEKIREVDEGSADLMGADNDDNDDDGDRMTAVSELVSLDPEFARNLMAIRYMTPEEIADLDLYFTIDSVSASTGKVRTFELVPGGADIPVTTENRLYYVTAVANFRLNVEIGMQSKAFFAGLECVVPHSSLWMFNTDELQRLISGARGPIDIADWRANTVYWDGYDDNSPSVVWFWEALGELSPSDQAAVLQFCTSCSRPPLLGFSQLKPHFAIKRMPADRGRLPSASTCSNLFKLPEVSSLEQMRRNLEIIVKCPTGFQYG